MKWIFATLLLLASCSRVSIDREMNSLECALYKRTLYNLAGRGSEKKEIGKALSQSITRDQAVQMTLNNHPGLQAELDSLGIAKADLVQAGLLTNPTLNLDWRLPRGRSCVEGNLLAVLTDIWQLPIRKRIAARYLEVTSYQLLSELLTKIAEAKRAYDKRLFTIASLAVGRQILNDLKATYEKEVYRHKFGLNNDLNIALSKVTASEQKAVIANLEQMDKASYVELRLVLGLDESFQPFDIGEAFIAPTESLPDSDRLIKRALACQPVLQKMRAQIAHARSWLRLEQWRVFRVVDGGVAVVKDPGEPAGFGPGISAQLPIFDQNQAQIAKARFQLNALCNYLKQKENEVVTSLKKAITKYQTAQDQLSLYAEEIFPEMEKAFAFIKNYSEFYQLDAIKQISASKMLAQTNLTYLEYMLDARLALIDIEELIGGSLITSSP